MDFHLYRGQAETQYLRVVVHMTVTGNNAVGVPYATAVILSGYSSGRSVLPPGDGTNGTIGTVEAEQLAIGTRLEYEDNFPIPEPRATAWDALNNAQKSALVATWRTNTSVPAKQADSVRFLQYFGASSN